MENEKTVIPPSSLWKYKTGEHGAGEYVIVIAEAEAEFDLVSGERVIYYRVDNKSKVLVCSKLAFESRFTQVLVELPPEYAQDDGVVYE